MDPEQHWPWTAIGRRPGRHRNVEIKTILANTRFREIEAAHLRTGISEMIRWPYGVMGERPLGRSPS